MSIAKIWFSGYFYKVGSHRGGQSAWESIQNLQSSYPGQSDVDYQPSWNVKHHVKYSMKLHLTTFWLLLGCQTGD